MSLTLSPASTPALTIKTFGDRTVYVRTQAGEDVAEISMEDFCGIVCYVMTNSDLAINDPRRRLKDFMLALAEVEGHNDRATRYV
jgi:hypothetical protein